MATVTGLTAARMLAIEAESVVGGAVNPINGHLILTRHDGSTIDAGPVVSTGNFVDIVTNQTIAGVKTFSSAPVVPANAFPESAITNLIADLAAKAPNVSVVHLTGAETIAGVKTFSSAPVVPANAFPESAINNLVADLAAKAADSSVVHLTGDQTVAGIKTFSSGLKGANSYIAELLNVSGTLVGGVAPAPSGTRYFWQGGSAIITTNSNADADIVMPTTFPNGVVTFVAISGDVSTFGGFFVNYPDWTTSVIVVHANHSDGSSAPGITCRCNWMALGW